MAAWKLLLGLGMKKLAEVRAYDMFAPIALSPLWVAPVLAPPPKLFDTFAGLPLDDYYAWIVPGYFTKPPWAFIDGWQSSMSWFMFERVRLPRMLTLFLSEESGKNKAYLLLSRWCGICWVAPFPAVSCCTKLSNWVVSLTTLCLLWASWKLKLVDSAADCCFCYYF